MLWGGDGNHPEIAVAFPVPNWIESPDYSPVETSDLQHQPSLVGLLDKASIDRGEQLSLYHALRVGILAGG